MKRLVVGIAIGMAFGVAATAGAVTARDVFLQRGDRVFGFGGETGCTVLPWGE
jgi:hypothetical protein